MIIRIRHSPSPMSRRLVITPRKQPLQARSRQMCEDILAASVRVLKREGALRFTTPRVAEAAGISVGSLYQYFPNKQSLLFALHARAIEQSWAEAQRILDEPRLRPREKLRRITRLYFLAETEDVAQMGAGLAEIELFFADQPERRAFEAQVLARFRKLVRESHPRAPAARVKFTAQLLFTLLGSSGKAVAELQLPARAVEKWARACADMLSDYTGLT
jgi:AcrR family transcriptional regulator